MSGGIENVSRKGVIPLNEENDLAASGQIALVKPTFAFLCKARDRKGDQKRADL